MIKASHTLFVTALLFILVGCGGSSVDLPEDVLTKDAYAVQWVDFKAIKPDDGVKMLGGLADDMPDDQPKARLWLSAEADDIDGGYRERWEAFTDAGCQGMLTVYYRVEKTEGPEGNTRSVVTWEKHTFIKGKKGTDTGDLEKALDAFAEDDGNDELKLDEVGDDTGWYWLTRGDAPDSAPSMPKKGDEETAKAFKKLLAKADGAPVITAWRTIKPITEAIDEEVKREGISDERKNDLELATATRSVVMSCSPGGSLKTSVVISFEESDQAKAFAEAHNEKLLSQRANMKRGMMNAENPPHPSVIDGLTESLEAKASGKTVTLKISSGSIKDMLNLIAAFNGTGGDGTSPANLLDLDSQLHVPQASDVPGVLSAYNTQSQFSFGRAKLPQSSR